MTTDLAPGTTAAAEAIARRNALTVANLPLVKCIAGDFAGRGLDRADLEQEGAIGLLTAAERFQPDRGQWSSFAAIWVKEPIRSALRQQVPTVRIPEPMFRRLAKARRDLEWAVALSANKKHTLELVARALELTRQGLAVVALVTQATGDETVDPAALSDLLAAIGDPRARRIIVDRFGLEGDEPMTRVAIGRRLGINREWVRQIEERTLQFLREEAGRRGLACEDFFLDQ